MPLKTDHSDESDDLTGVQLYKVLLLVLELPCTNVFRAYNGCAMENVTAVGLADFEAEFDVLCRHHPPREKSTHSFGFAHRLSSPSRQANTLLSSMSLRPTVG